MESRRDELTRKLAALVNRDHGGDFLAAFRHYAPGGKLYEDQIYTLLSDADVGSWFTRGAYARGLLAAVDTDGDGGITFTEFEAAVVRPRADRLTATDLERRRNLAILHRLSAECNPHEPEEFFALGILGQAVTQIESGE